MSRCPRRSYHPSQEGSPRGPSRSTQGSGGRQRERRAGPGRVPHRGSVASQRRHGPDDPRLPGPRAAPRPERRGRANVYADAHLARLRQIADLLDRGYTLASIKELLEAWDAGRGWAGSSGWSRRSTDRGATRRPCACRGPSWTSGSAAVRTTRRWRRRWSSECWSASPARVRCIWSRAPRAGCGGGVVRGGRSAVRDLGPSAGVEGKVEHIAARFLEFTTEHVFARYLGEHPPSDAEAAEAASPGTPAATARAADGGRGTGPRHAAVRDPTPA